MSKLFLLLDYKLCHFLLYRPPTSLFGLFGLYLFRPNVEQSRHLPSSFCYFLFIGEAVGWQRFYFLADNKNNVDDDDDDENSQATPSTKKVSRLILATPPAPPPLLTLRVEGCVAVRRFRDCLSLSLNHSLDVVPYYHLSSIFRYLWFIFKSYLFLHFNHTY